MTQAQNLHPFNQLVCRSGDLTNTDNVMNNTLWVGMQPALPLEMLEFAASKIESYLGLNF